MKCCDVLISCIETAMDYNLTLEKIKFCHGKFLGVHKADGLDFYGDHSREKITARRLNRSSGSSWIFPYKERTEAHLDITVGIAKSEQDTYYVGILQ